MSKSLVRWIGLAGSLLTGAAVILGGDVVTGFGIISSGLASAEVIPGLK